MAALVPVYRETGKIGRVLSRFAGVRVDQVYVIVDRPTEALLREIRSEGQKAEVPLCILENAQRRGIGHALRQGIHHALNAGCEVIVVMAGNGKDDPREVPRILRPILEEGYDYVQGSRFLPGGKAAKTPILRAIFTRLYPFVWRMAVGGYLTDVTNGFRAYRASVFRDGRIDISQRWLDGYALEFYTLYKVLTLGYRTREVPVSKRYPYRHKGGYSKIAPLRDWWDIVSPLLYLRLGARR